MKICLYYTKFGLSSFFYFFALRTIQEGKSVVRFNHGEFVSEFVLTGVDCICKLYTFFLHFVVNANSRLACVRLELSYCRIRVKTSTQRETAPSSDLVSRFARLSGCTVFHDVRESQRPVLDKEKVVLICCAVAFPALAS